MPAVTQTTASPPGLSPESPDPVPRGAGRAENARDPQGAGPALPRRELRRRTGRRPGPQFWEMEKPSLGVCSGQLRSRIGAVGLGAWL